MQIKNLSNSCINNQPWTWLSSASVLYLVCSAADKKLKLSWTVSNWHLCRSNTSRCCIWEGCWLCIISLWPHFAQLTLQRRCRSGGNELWRTCTVLCWSWQPEQSLWNSITTGKQQSSKASLTHLLCQTRAWLPQHESMEGWLNKIKLHVSHNWPFVLILQNPCLKLLYNRRGVFISYYNKKKQITRVWHQVFVLRTLYIFWFIQTHAHVFSYAQSNQADFKHLPKRFTFLLRVVVFAWFHCELGFFSKEKRTLSYWYFYLTHFFLPCERLRF